MLSRAKRFASETGGLAGTLHMLYSILEQESSFAVKILRSLGVDVRALKDAVFSDLTEIKTKNVEPTDGFEID